MFDNNIYFETKEDVVPAVLNTLKNIIADNKNLEKILVYFVRSDGSKYGREFQSPQEFLNYVNR
jgi:hypothetical protein